MRLIDVHAHLQDPAFDTDLGEVLQRAAEAGVTATVLPGTTMADSRRAVQLAERHHGLWAMVGVHPHEAKDWESTALTELEEMLKHPKVLGIAEIGLDFHYAFSTPEQQRLALTEQWCLAARLGAPVEVHVREAFPEFFGTVAQLPPPPRVMLHCYSGGFDETKIAVKQGWHFSIGGSLTFKKAEECRAIFAELPADRVHLETDCPYLSPEPFRGRRNEPGNLSHTLQRLAEVRRQTHDTLADQLWKNARDFFGPRLHP
ncbi:MAG TPA: TatD family hydrolase [Candidatus Ozemobacteraceae bacterium]|nr:TatD family hydrolase [Candidatus Ozemobacteraceae bacterium]